MNKQLSRTIQAAAAATLLSLCGYPGQAAADEGAWPDEVPATVSIDGRPASASFTDTEDYGSGPQAQGVPAFASIEAGPAVKRLADNSSQQPKPNATPTPSY